MGRLRLSEHGGRVQCRAPRPGEELGGAEEHRRPILPGCAVPVFPCLGGGLDCLLDVSCAALVHLREDVVLVVRHDSVERLARANLLAADHERELDLLRAHLLEPDAQLFALRRARCVVLDRLVLRRRRAEKTGRGGHLARL